MNGERSCREEVLEIVRELPGVMFKDIAALMPHRSKSSVSAMLATMHNTGELHRDLVTVGKMPFGGDRKSYAYRINPDGVKVKTRKVRLKTPTTPALEARVRELEADLRVLERWKADAIARFPDLDVDPVVLDARKIVAAEIEASGDKALAAAVRSGSKDTILPMRVTIAALQRPV